MEERAKTLRELASYDLPPRPSMKSLSIRTITTDTSGGAYFYLDEQDRAVVGTAAQRIEVIGHDDQGFRLDRTYDLAPVVTAGGRDDAVVTVLPDWSGRWYWFVTRLGMVGTVDRESGSVATRQLEGERIQNSFAVGRDGAFIVSDHALYAFVADPVIGVLQEGAVVELTALRAGDGGPTTLAWELRTARLQRPIEAFPARDLHGNTMTIQLPTLHRADAAGVRPVEDGVWSLLARLPDAEGKPFSVLARVKPIRRAEEAVESGWFELNEPVRWSSSDPPPDEGDSLPARAARGEIEDAAAGLLEVRGVVLSTELAAGSVVEAAAAAVALDRAVPLDPADLGVSTGLVRGARATCLLQETYVRDYDIESVGIMGQDSTADPEVGEQVSGLVAEVDEGGALRLSWTSTPEWNRFQFSPAPNLGMLAVDVPTSAVREARVVPGEGTRLVVLARLEDGRSAGVLVRFGKY